MDAQLDQTTCPTTVLLVYSQNVCKISVSQKVLYIFPSFSVCLPNIMPLYGCPIGPNHLSDYCSPVCSQNVRVKRPILKKFYIFFFLLSLFAKHHAPLFMDGICLWYTQRKFFQNHCVLVGGGALIWPLNLCFLSRECWVLWVFANTYQSIGGLRCWMLWVWVFADTNLCLWSNF